MNTALAHFDLVPEMTDQEIMEQSKAVFGDDHDLKLLVKNLRTIKDDTTIERYLREHYAGATEQEIQDALQLTGSESTPSPENVQSGVNPTQVAPIALSPFEERALPMIALGIPVIPLRTNDKKAFLDEWQQLATTDLAQIALWGKQYPNANCGCVGQAKIGGFVFFEVDSREVRQRILAETGNDIMGLQTLKVRSRTGRGHLYFKQTEKTISVGNITQAYVKHGDWSFRGNNAYVLSAKSIHPVTLQPYEVLDDLPIIDCPDWLVDWLLSQKTTKSSENPNAEPERNAQGQIPQGSIHGWMLRQAGSLRQMGLDKDMIHSVLKDIVEKNCQGPIDWKKVEAMATSICRYSAGTPAVDILAGMQAPVEVEGDRLSLDLTTDEAEGSIPAFDPSVIKGVYLDVVTELTKGTTLAPQFTYAIAKTTVGAMMAGRFTFEDLDVEPLNYLALCGKTGSGKGEAWRRFEKILKAKLPDSMTIRVNNLSCAAGLKIVNSADSGAGLRDVFFDEPKTQPVLCFVDEVASLGHKADSKKNPEILDRMGELANSHSISVVKARRSKNFSGTQTSDTAYLAVVMCGQNSEVWTTAFTGRTDIGWFDRIVPEHGVQVEPGKLPPVPDEILTHLLIRLLALPFPKPGYRQHMKISPEASTILEDYWRSMPDDIRKIARLKSSLKLDGYLIAFGQGRLEMSAADAQDAIKNFSRQVIIRRVMFRGEAPDRVGFFLGRIKEATEAMKRQLEAGASKAQVAQSMRDFQRYCNAHRKNELHTFGVAWRSYYKDWLEPIQCKAKNGKVVERYVPRDDDD